MNRKCELLDFFSGWMREISMDKEHEYNFHARNCPPPLPVFDSDAIIIKKTHKNYNGHFRVDAIEIFSSKKTLRAFGLLLLSSVFHPDIHNIRINVRNELSDVKTIIIKPLQPLVCETPGFHLQPLVFNYWPNDISKHPWLYRHIPDPYDYPRFNLTNNDDSCDTDEDFNKRDVLLGFGSAIGTVLLAELFLNLSRIDNAQDEIVLEGEGGFRGVGPKSCEVTMWLPGSFNWWGDIAKSLAT